MLLSEGSADTFMQLTKKNRCWHFCRTPAAAGQLMLMLSTSWWWSWCQLAMSRDWGRLPVVAPPPTPGGRTSRWTTAKLPFLWSPLLRFCQQHFQTKSQLLRIRNIKYILIFTQPGRLCFLPPPHLHLTKTMTSNVSVWRSFTRGNKININPEKCLLTLNAVQTLRIV